MDAQPAIFSISQHDSYNGKASHGHRFPLCTPTPYDLLGSPNVSGTPLSLRLCWNLLTSDLDSSEHLWIIQ